MKVGVLLPPLEVTGGFAEGARTAAHNVQKQGFDLDVRHGYTGEPDETWQAVLCHGVQYRNWLAGHRCRPAVLTDRPTDTSGLAGVTLVDWAWHEAAYEAGRFASEQAEGAPIGLVAGPAVLTQRRFAQAFTEGAYENGHTGAINVVHLKAFDDTENGCRAGEVLVGELNCAVIAHAADSAGEVACTAARSRNARTIGFVEPLGEHLATVHSDISGVLEHLLTALATGAALPEVYECGLRTGHLALVTEPTW
ncbi:BMP family ABC transporter substrate-binding protein [Kineosporia babensis]|uniref:BMP family ABC transporter substrate-binding protein n=1 Tax=Kineosporia babensis TaxID=499548 RepID=A0A9X1T4V9_9ACTN|nr:BMP family ABC transporter substrate-binding protein [Kineosporia babensis]MCD5317038.1 BMP family ABC transporter substrate-binding protein [Kineosporia babensis]